MAKKVQSSDAELDAPALKKQRTMEAEPKKVEIEDLAAKILKQVEYYFGDINLPRDKFLQEKMKKDNGWVELTMMLKFNRLAQLTTDVEKIAEVLQSSQLVEVSEDKLKIHRLYPVPDNTFEYWQEIKRRTAYIGGFDPETKLEEIESFLAPYGEIQNVVMRRLKENDTFKGSVFSTFVDEETAVKFVKDESENSLNFNHKPLIKKMQNDYWQEKTAAAKERRKEKKQIKFAKKSKKRKKPKKSKKSENPGRSSNLTKSES